MKAVFIPTIYRRYKYSLYSFQDLPKHIYFGGLRILVSPFMMFDVATKTTDIIMFNSQNLGALIVDEKPHVKSWDEPQYSIHNLGIEESYGFGVLNEGQAIAVAKNVKVRQNEMSTPRVLIISTGSTLRSSSLLLGSSVALPSTSTTTTTTSTRSASSANNSVNRRPRADAELRSAAGDSRRGCRVIQC